MEKEWYVVNTYSGHENKVKEKLEMRASTMGMEDYIFRVVVPEQTQVEAWFIVRNTPGVTGFIGSSGKGAKPFPLTPQEVDKILGNMGMSRLDIGNEVQVGDTVRVINGAFANMYGKVKNIDLATQKLEVALDLFGQETIVEVEFNEIEKTN